jgi:hypothetical protein
LEGEMLEMCTPIWPEANFEIKMYRILQLRSTFGSWDSEERMPMWREYMWQLQS